MYGFSVQLPGGNFQEAVSRVTEALKAQGFEVPRAAIRMPEGPLKQVGDQPVKIALHTDVVVTITVSVLGEQA